MPVRCQTGKETKISVPNSNVRLLRKLSSRKLSVPCCLVESRRGPCLRSSWAVFGPFWIKYCRHPGVTTPPTLLPPSLAIEHLEMCQHHQVRRKDNCSVVLDDVGIKSAIFEAADYDSSRLVTTTFPTEPFSMK